MKNTRYQDGLTIFTEVIPGREEELRTTLNEIGRDIEGNDLVPFLQLRTVHFARWFMLEAGSDDLGRQTNASLVFSSNFDEPREKHLEELYEKAGRGLDAIYRHCRDYPPDGQRTRTKVLDYLRRHQIGYNTLYVGARGRSVEQIHREAELREAIQGFLDEATTDTGFMDQEPAAIRQLIQEFVRGREDLRWALDPPPHRSRFWPRWRDAGVILPLLAIVLVPIVVGALITALTGLVLFLGILVLLAVAVGLGLLAIRGKERTDEIYPPRADFQHVAGLTQEEDRFVQNAMSVVNTVKAGPLRRLTLRIVLRAIDLAARYVATRGDLGGIPSIHFARWVVIEDGRRVLFMSNYDGSWESYLGDFVDKAATGLTAVWSNTHGFPRSRNLVQDGATDEQRFTLYARRSQLPTQVWYTAYKWLSVQNVNNNSDIRAGLFGRQTPRQTAAWLQKL